MIFWPQICAGQGKVQGAAEAGEQHVRSRLRTPQQHDSEEARCCKAATEPAQESRRGKLRRHHRR